MPARFAHTSDFAFVDDLLAFGDDYKPQIGDTVEHDGSLKTIAGDPVTAASAKVVASSELAVVLRSAEGKDLEIPADSWFYVTESPTIAGVWDKHLRRDDPDGVAFADDIVDPALADRLRADFRRLLDEEPVDYHPGSGTKVRNLVHPSLFPYIEGRSALTGSVVAPEAPSHDRFGRPYERSKFQWLPTPFRIADDGTAKALSYINNLDPVRHAGTYDNLAFLLTAALPLIESVVGYVDGTQFWRDGQDALSDESELPEDVEGARVPAAPTSLRGRELLVIPKLVEYHLAAGESHEGVWHVEGMSHEHIVATCVYVLDRDEALHGGALHFKRAYTLDEAGRLFWTADQGRPPPVGALVDEGTIPLGSVETRAGRIVVFPNSHIHKLDKLSLLGGAAEGRRRVIVFWVVDPSVTIPSTREVPAQHQVIPREEALAMRLELMEERRRHKQTLNVRAVNLCEH